MGHYSHNCKLTGLPITGGTPVVLFPMVMSKNLYENENDNLRKNGSTYMCSNDGNRLKFIPCYFPIRGDYDDYGGIENIIEDDGTRILEKYFDLTIQQICNVITSGRKDDGYDSSLNCIKDPEALDKNGRKLGDDKYDDYNNPQYLDRYKELIGVSGMWIHRGVYDKLTEKKEVVDEYGGLDLGTPALLEALGFTEIENGINPKGHDPERYNRQFKKGELIVHSDGTWINIPNESIYRISDFVEYCERMGEPIEDLESHKGKTYIEQLFDYVIPNNETFWIRPDENEEGLKVTDAQIDSYISKWKETFEQEISREDAREFIIETKLNNYSRGHDRESKDIAYRLLNTDGYSCYKIKNNIVFDYYDACKRGELRDVLRRFWQFDKYLYATGTFYDIVGTSPQDGEIDLVKQVLDTAKELADERYKDYHEEDY
jgi:hypothetical protein